MIFLLLYIVIFLPCSFANAMNASENRLFFEEFFNNLNMPEEEKKSFRQFTTNYNDTVQIKIKESNTINPNDNDSLHILFYAWLLKKSIPINDKKKELILIEGDENYVFLDKDTFKGALIINNSYTRFLVNTAFYLFEGLEGKFIGKMNFSNIHILKDPEEIKHLQTNDQTDILNAAKCVYKIHLMPDKKCVMNVLYKLFKENPTIYKDYRLKKCIQNIKVLRKHFDNMNEERNQTIPLIVIYVNNFFITAQNNQKEIDFNNKNVLFKGFDYKKSKECTEQLLIYLVWFFNKTENQDCIGSNITPRYNQKVTDIVYFAQGNGWDKEIYREFYKEPDLVYFKANEGEYFEIDSKTILNIANNTYFDTPDTDQKLFNFHFQRLNLSTVEEESWSLFNEKRINLININMNDKGFRYIKKSNSSNCILFIAWLLSKDNLHSESKKKINGDKNYLELDESQQKESILIQNDIYFRLNTGTRLFQGIKGEFTSPRNTVSNFDLFTTMKDEKIKNNIIEWAKTEYKIHLMPTQKSCLQTISKLIDLIKKNPLISSMGLRLNDCIHMVKISIDPFMIQYDSENNIMPLIVIYVSNAFLPKPNLENKDKEDPNKYIDYKKSKECTEQLLIYLVWFFNQPENQNCMGSSITPRFNQKVTNMIYFAQGNGGDKKRYRKLYKEPDLVYFKANEGEYFEINTQKILLNAYNLMAEKIGPGLLILSLAHLATQKNNPQKTFTSPSEPHNKPAPVKKDRPTLEEPSSIFRSFLDFLHHIFYKLFYILNF